MQARKWAAAPGDCFLFQCVACD